MNINKLWAWLFLINMNVNELPVQRKIASAGPVYSVLSRTHHITLCTVLQRGLDTLL